MNRQVVVATDSELGTHETDAIAALHDGAQAVDYHLLITSRPVGGGNPALASLGVEDSDTFGSPALARLMHAVPDERPNDLAHIMTRSADRLRALNRGAVTVSITHDDLFLGIRTVIRATGSRDVILVAAPGGPRLAPSDGLQRVSDYLDGSTVHTIERDEPDHA